MNQQVLEAAQSVWEKTSGDKPSWPSFKERVLKMDIKVHWGYPPIPDRRFDYIAVPDDFYDGTGPVGYGASEHEAMEDLISYHI